LASAFRWDTSKFESPKIMERKLQRAVFGVARYWDGPIEAHMKHNAPWTDRTTNARNGLKAEAVKFSDRLFGIILSHGVSYGIYLEKSNDGDYAIVIPTLGLYGPKVIKTLTKILDRLGSQG
jgi:hypothetical protein